MSFTPLNKRDRVFLDLETTGLDKNQHEIIEIALHRETYKGDLVCQWEAKVAPKYIEAAQPKALELNGYSPKAWESAQPFEELQSTLLSDLWDCILIGHNIEFDYQFLISEFNRRGYRNPPISYSKVDTTTLAYTILAPQGLERLSLNSICTFLNISNEGEHTALADVLRCREVYHTLTKDLPRNLGNNV